MSTQNVQIVKEIYAAWERGDFSSSDWADPEIEYSAPGPDRPTKGVDAMASSWAEWLRSFKDFRVIPEEIHDAGDKVVVIQSFGGQGRASGISVDQIPGAAMLTLRDGKVIRFQGYLSRDQAFADAGLV